MTLITRIRAADSRKQAAARSKNGPKGGVSGTLRDKLGEELSAMLERVGRKFYAAGCDQIKRAISDSLLANQPALLASVRSEYGRRGATQARKAVREWLDEIVGEVLTDVAEDVYKDLPSLADAITEGMDDEGDPEGDEPEEDGFEEAPEVDEGEGVEEDDLGEEEEEEEGEMLESDADDADEIRQIAEELEDVKASGQTLAARLAAVGDPDSAAYLRMIIDQL